MTIESLRQKIDKIDLEILYLLQRRAKLAIDIGKIKSQQNLPIYNAQREANIIMDLQQQNANPLDKDSIKNIFGTIIRECRILQTNSIINAKEEKQW